MGSAQLSQAPVELLPAYTPRSSVVSSDDLSSLPAPTGNPVNTETLRVIRKPNVPVPTEDVVVIDPKIAEEVDAVLALIKSDVSAEIVAPSRQAFRDARAEVAPSREAFRVARAEAAAATFVDFQDMASRLGANAIAL